MKSTAGIGLSTSIRAGSDVRRRLQLVADTQPLRGAGRHSRELELLEQDHSAQMAERVLVAGAQTDARMRMLAELRSLLPPDTGFIEASETWEVIARAADSRMVVLTGELDGVSTDSLLRLLARRNPSLPVLAVGKDRRLHTPARAGRSEDREQCEIVDAARA